MQANLKCMRCGSSFLVLREDVLLGKEIGCPDCKTNLDDKIIESLKRAFDSVLQNTVSPTEGMY